MALFSFWTRSLSVCTGNSIKFCTPGFIGSHPDVAPVIFDDLAHDGESQARSILLGGKIGLENSASNFWRHTAAVIRDLQTDDSSRAVMTGGDSDFAIFAYSGHRVVQ